MKIAVSVGDLNGIGIEIALRAHEQITQLCHPIYTIDPMMLERAANLLKLKIPEDFECEPVGTLFELTPGEISAESGVFSYDSFIKALEMTRNGESEAFVTLPIHKEAWARAGIPYKGHTDALSEILHKEAIMMIGCERLFTALFTHHIPLRKVPQMIKERPLKRFLCDLYHEIKEERIGVLGLNPHAGDGGILGNEEEIIQRAIEAANRELMEEIFHGPLVPDTAFSPHSREHTRYFVCMYHDQGLIAVKSLYFDESINVSLNLPVVRTSVDHGTAFDIAYRGARPSIQSYLNAVKEAIRLAGKRKSYRI
ncbi:MAG: 4-hydroxythreonine-4-phosphate dehydrogenase PdxA [Campylobacteraceae bacterium 4484_4]|nr:MAG: 4-hydroxythreonine-4-phosphate dehydrogenase PdxA [Campylobacteraceae bacterium 4484_4]